MKKLLLTLCMVFTLCGCGGEKGYVETVGYRPLIVKPEHRPELYVIPALMQAYDDETGIMNYSLAAEKVTAEHMQAHLEAQHALGWYIRALEMLIDGYNEDAKKLNEIADAKLRAPKAD